MPSCAGTWPPATTSTTCPTSATCTPTAHSSSTLSRPPPSTATSMTTTTSAPQRTRPARSAAPASASKQCSGSPIRFGWQTSGPCGATWPCSSASSPRPCRSTSAWCPGRKTPSPSCQGTQGLSSCPSSYASASRSPPSIPLSG
uniref:DS cell adhesion molecule like 1 n=1 Tax=Salmo trutta TaxID=8032 RepID=A0A673Y1I0_SALTR